MGRPYPAGPIAQLLQYRAGYTLEKLLKKVTAPRRFDHDRIGRVDRFARNLSSVTFMLYSTIWPCVI